MNCIELLKQNVMNQMNCNYIAWLCYLLIAFLFLCFLLNFIAIWIGTIGERQHLSRSVKEGECIITSFTENLEG